MFSLCWKGEKRNGGWNAECLQCLCFPSHLFNVDEVGCESNKIYFIIKKQKFYIFEDSYLNQLFSLAFCQDILIYLILQRHLISIEFIIKITNLTSLEWVVLRNEGPQKEKESVTFLTEMIWNPSHPPPT